MGQAQSKPQPDPQALEHAFGVFNELSARLTDAYGQLEKRVAGLTQELARARSAGLAETAKREHLADQLGVLLEALPAAVVLVDRRDRVDRFNPAAEQLFPGLSWGRRWSEVKAEVVAAEPSPGDWHLRDGRRVSVSQRPLNDRGRVLVVVDTTDQRRMQERVERQNRLSAMGEMAAQLAHQVRTPLSTSVLYAGQLAKGNLSDEQRQQFGSKLLEGLRHTESLVRDMLAFSRGGSFSTSPVVVGEILETAIGALQPRLRQLNAELELDRADLADTTIMGNRDALAGAFSNLLDNALNHGGAQTRIRIGLAVAEGDTLQISFDDDGPGIDTAVMPKIFDPFFTTCERGTGLGLAVVQAVILEHGGSVQAGRSECGGARFEIQLPVRGTLPQQQPTSRKQY